MEEVLMVMDAAIAVAMLTKCQYSPQILSWLYYHVLTVPARRF